MSHFTTSSSYKTPMPPTSTNTSRHPSSGRYRSVSRDRSISTTYGIGYARPLPPGPGPLDSTGKKIATDHMNRFSTSNNIGKSYSSSSSSSYKPRSSSRSITNSGPLKASHDYSTTTTSSYSTTSPSYASSKYNADNTTSPSYASSKYNADNTKYNTDRERPRSRTSSDIGSITKHVNSVSLDPDEGYGSLTSSDRSRKTHRGENDFTNSHSLTNSDKAYSSQTYEDVMPNKISSYNRYNDTKSDNDSKSSTKLISAIYSPVINSTSPARDSGSQDNSASSTPVKTRAQPAGRRISDVSGHSSRNSVTESSQENNGLVGLRNLGNTCFMNSVLQCLSNTKPLLDYCIKEDYMLDINKKTSSMKGNLITAYANLMKSLWKDKTDAHVSPNTFKNQIQKFAPRFMGYDQQDAQEFLRYLMMGLHDDVNQIQTKPKPVAINENDEYRLTSTEKARKYWTRYLNFDKSTIVDIFVGQLRSTLTCMSCKHPSVTFDPFWDLSVPLLKGRSSSHIGLSDCVSLFMKEETLDGEERPRCAKCKSRQRCTKSFSIQRFPKILVLHLKRFSQDRFRSKLSTFVDFPMKLDLSQFSSDQGVSASYSLYGVSNHSGGVYSGHYTAYCKHPNLGQWYYFNDSRVTKTSSSQIVSAEAYVLFYEWNSAGGSKL